MKPIMNVHVNLDGKEKIALKKPVLVSQSHVQVKIMEYVMIITNVNAWNNTQVRTAQVYHFLGAQAMQEAFIL